MSRAKAPRQIRLTNPRALRALAHPTRLALLGLLRREGPLTATQASELIDESPSSCSFHFRQLAKYGLVEEAPRGRGRDRPWQATAMFTSWPNVAETPEMAAAAVALDAIVLERYFDQVMHWVDERAKDPPAWQEASGFGDTMLYLTPKEAKELEGEFTALSQRYFERTVNPRLRPLRSRRVTAIYFLFPAREQRRAKKR